MWCGCRFCTNKVDGIQQVSSFNFHKRGRSVMTHGPPPKYKEQGTKPEQKFLSRARSLFFCVWLRSGKSTTRTEIEHKAHGANWLFSSRGWEKQFPPNDAVRTPFFFGKPMWQLWKELCWQSEAENAFVSSSSTAQLSQKWTNGLAKCVCCRVKTLIIWINAR